MRGAFLVQVSFRMTSKKVDSPYLNALDSRVLVYDGAMGTSIQRFNLTPEDFGGKSL
jgi:5-methyltetrahydrofolate--homocysteine methyltransferase